MKLNNSKITKIKTLSLILMILVSSLTLSLFLNITEDQKNNDKQIESDNKNDLLNNLEVSGLAGWWNGTFRYRIEVNLTEPGYFDRSFEPVDVILTFVNGKCHKDTIRVVEYIPAIKNAEIHSQVWDLELYSGTDFVKSCKVTFLATVNKGTTKSYYIYYSDINTGISNPKQQYLAESGFINTFDDVNDKLSLTTTQFNLELEKNRGIYNLSKNGANYHTEKSLAPWIANGQLDSTIYNPGIYGGNIKNWLVIGPFPFLTDSGNYWSRVTGNDYHFDVKKQYVAGDYALGGTVPSQFLDETKTWSYVDFSVLSQYEYYDDFGGGFIDLNEWNSGAHNGAPERVCIYTSCYIRSPVDVDAYLKVGSDDGIQIWRDGVRIHNNPVLRSPQADRELANNGQALHFNAGQWYYFIVVVEEYTGETGFHFRFSTNPTLYSSNPASDPGKITNLDVAMIPPIPLITSISQVSEEQIGPVFAKYNVEWQTSGDMHTTDTITIYNNYSLWNVERTIYWDNTHDNMPFSVYNTFYNNTQSGIFDYYFYDKKYSSISSTPPHLQVENYTIIRDNKPTNNGICIGTFISNIYKGGSLDYQKILWGIYNDSVRKIINLAPGDDTKLDNGAGGSSNYIQVTFWEYLNNTLLLTNPIANTTFVGVYNSLKNPLIQSKDIEESTFFDLTVITKDHDGNLVEDVKVLLYNNSNILDQSESIQINQTTDQYGSTTFERLPNATYLLNFTFSDDLVEFFVKTNVEVILDETKTITVTDLNLTSIYLELSRVGDFNDKIKGAQVEFWYINSTRQRNYKIKTESTDNNGKVLFVWQNKSQSEANISVNVNVLGVSRLINRTAGDFFSYLNYTFESRTNENISVQIDPYTTYLDRIEPQSASVTDKFKGESIYFKVRYYYIQGVTQNNIDGATVNYIIIDTSTQEEKITGQFNPVLGGNYSYNLDTSDSRLISSTQYKITITAQKPGFTLINVEVYFTLKDILATLTIENDIDYIEVAWNNNITIRVSYNNTLNGNIGLNESTVYYSVSGKPSIAGNLVEENIAGWYNLTLNSTEFTLRGIYYLYIFAYKLNYELKEKFITINITQIHTSLISNASQIDVIWNNIFSMIVTYNDTDNDKLISTAAVTYTVLGITSGTFENDGNGNYTLTLNSSFTNAFSYTLKVAALLSNYETQELFIPLNILEIPTIINGKISEIITVDYYVGTPHPLTFNYNVTLSSDGIKDAHATYNWQKDSGDFYPGTLTNGSIDGQYILNFDTELRTIGRYSLVIKLEKDNYETRTATYIINIIEREIDYELDAPGLKNDQINIIKGKEVKIELKLVDETNDQKLRGADVVLKIGDDEFEFDEDEAGLYVYTFSTKKYEAFFTSLTLTGEISIKAANFTSETLDITIVVEMEEIYPGVATFYFIMIIGAIAAVVGSLATYRYIQVARIPTFVKKTRKIKKAIKSSKAIEESLLYPSKEEYMIKRLDDKYQLLGLSMEDTLGIKGKKGPTISQESNSIKKKEV